jgi:hypothetical protein
MCIYLSNDLAINLNIYITLIDEYAHPHFQLTAMIPMPFASFIRFADRIDGAALKKVERR